MLGIRRNKRSREDDSSTLYRRKLSSLIGPVPVRTYQPQGRGFDQLPTGAMEQHFISVLHGAVDTWRWTKSRVYALRRCLEALADQRGPKDMMCIHVVCRFLVCGAKRMEKKYRFGEGIVCTSEGTSTKIYNYLSGWAKMSQILQPAWSGLAYSIDWECGMMISCFC